MYMIGINASIMISSTATIADYWWYWIFNFARLTFTHAIFCVHLARLIDQTLWHRPQLIWTSYHDVGQFTALSRHSHLSGYIVFISRMNVSVGKCECKIKIEKQTFCFKKIVVHKNSCSHVWIIIGKCVRNFCFNLHDFYLGENSDGAIIVATLCLDILLYCWLSITLRKNSRNARNVFRFSCGNSKHSIDITFNWSGTGMSVKWNEMKTIFSWVCYFLFPLITLWTWTWHLKIIKIKIIWFFLLNRRTCCLIE